MAPASTRSASISSTSTASSKSGFTDPKKKFACSFPDCGKSFSRSEHLHRHALNHKDGNNTCLRCRAHFRRRDLLGG
jgi:Zinc finger, C2H2 type